MQSAILGWTNPWGWKMSDAGANSNLTPPTERDPAPWSTFYVGTLGVLIVILTVIGVEVLYYKSTAGEFVRKDIEQGASSSRATTVSNSTG